ncbi:HIRAN domain-containing protein [Tenacibaculum sp. UWU-22]|uniref:HIRAN domain-containing protein n=1 Tax=Tenacibaculum sp. UWU-22 TaxID=3234187 RepID=UPI0034DB6C19
MKRRDFIRSIGVASGSISLPTPFFHQKSVKIYDNYLSGLNYYQYKKIKKKLRQGTEITLQRDSKNLYDSFAVEVYLKNDILGYIKAFENICIANLLDAGAKLSAEVSSHVEGDKYLQQTLSVAIYVDIISATDRLITELQTIRADNAHDIYRKGSEP